MNPAAHGLLTLSPRLREFVATRVSVRAVVNGVTLAGPTNLGLARELGLQPPPPPAPASAEKPLPDCLAPSAERALKLMRDHGKPVTRRDFRESYGQSNSQCDGLMNGIRLLLEHRLAEVISGKGLSSAPYTWGLTEAGRSWQPKATRPISDAEILAAVARINTRPRSAGARCWWNGHRPEYPASPSTVCDELLANGRKRQSLALLSARLQALAEAGQLEAHAIRRRGGNATFYWIPAPGSPSRG